MKKTKRFLVSMLAIALFVHFGISRCGAAPPAEEIRKVALESWARYAKFIQFCEGTLREQTIKYSENNSIIEDETEISDIICKWPYTLSVIRVADKESTSVLGYNKTYRFWIKKKSPADPWKIMSAEPPLFQRPKFSW